MIGKQSRTNGELPSPAPSIARDRDGRSERTLTVGWLAWQVILGTSWGANDPAAAHRVCQAPPVGRSEGREVGAKKDRWKRPPPSEILCPTGQDPG